MNDNHRIAIKRKLRVVVRYLQLVDSMLDVDDPESAELALHEIESILRSLKLPVEDAGKQGKMVLRHKAGE